MRRRPWRLTLIAALQLHHNLGKERSDFRGRTKHGLSPMQRQQGAKLQTARATFQYHSNFRKHNKPNSHLHRVALFSVTLCNLMLKFSVLPEFALHLKTRIHPEPSSWYGLLAGAVSYKAYIWKMGTDEQHSCRCPDWVWTNTGGGGGGSSHRGGSQLFADSCAAEMKEQQALFQAWSCSGQQQPRSLPSLMRLHPAPPACVCLAGGDTHPLCG